MSATQLSVSPSQNLVVIPAEQLEAMELSIKALRLAIEELRGGSSQVHAETGALNGGNNGGPTGWKDVAKTVGDVIVSIVSKIPTNDQGTGLFMKLATDAMEESRALNQVLRFGFMKQMGVPAPAEHMTIVK